MNKGKVDFRKYRVMNFRPFVVLALTMIVAVFSAVYISNTARLVLFITALSIFGIIFAMTICLKRKVLILVSALFLVIATAFGLVFAKSSKLESYQKYAGEDVVVYAKISDNYKITTTGNLSVKLSDVYVKTESGFVAIDGKLNAYTNPSHIDLRNFSVGRYVVMKMKLTIFDLDAHKGDMSRTLSFLSSNITGIGYANFYNIEFTETYDVSARDYICLNIYNDLYATGLEYGDLAYAMLFGESSFVDEGVNAEFKTTGIAHLIAVSGLHFSIIFMMISFIAKKSKLGYRSCFLIQAIAIFLYCYLCKFSVSVVRAGLMAFVSAYASLRGKNYDSPSALAFVALILLLINPLMLFNVSFVLSFSAVLSIMFLVPVLSRCFSKFFNESVASLVAINCAVQLGMFAINLYYFGRYALFSGIINLILIPISTIAFGFLFVGVLLSRAVPIAIYLSKGFDFFIDIVVKMNSYFAINGIFVGIGNVSILPAIFILLGMFIVSDFLFLRRKTKVVAASASLALGILAFLL